MSFEMPLFPLNVVLFPGMPLPLHIFEPRYRLMIERCLDGDSTFGVAQIIEGQEGEGGTLPAPIGCAAEIIEVAPLADGRLNVHTLGTRRFEIVALRDQDDYLVGTCRWIEDDEGEDGLVRASMKVRQLLSRYFDSLALSTELPADLGELDVPQDPFALSMFIAAIMNLPNNQKQTLLEMTSTKARLEIEEFLLERADIVHRAFAKRAAQGSTEPPVDQSLGHYANFVSLN